jgi:hypothetical protein
MYGADEPPQWRAWAVAAGIAVAVLGTAWSSGSDDAVQQATLPGSASAPLPPDVLPEPAPDDRVGSDPGADPGADPTPTEPAPGEHFRYDGYEIHPCAWRDVAGGTTWPAPHPPTRVVPGQEELGDLPTVHELGHLDVSDGRLGWQDGVLIGIGPESPYDPFDTLEVLPGRARVLAVVTNLPDGSGGSWRSIDAVVVVLDDADPVRWREDAAAGFGTDGGVGGVGGEQAVARLAAVRSFDDAYAELDDVFRWRGDCLAYRATSSSSLPSSSDARDAPTWDMFVARPGGDGGYPGAVGVDAQGRPVAVATSFGGRPFTCLGLPGTPPDPVVEQEGGRSCEELEREPVD